MSKDTFMSLREKDFARKKWVMEPKEDVPADMRKYIDENIKLDNAQLQKAYRRWNSYKVWQRENVLKTLKLDKAWMTKPLNEFPHYAKLLVADFVLID